MSEKILKIDRLCRISSPYAHSAFTGLIENGETFLCCYRQALTHVSDDGRIEVTSVTGDGRVTDRQRLSLPGYDLRDPKLSRDDNGRLWLIAFARPVTQATRGNRFQMVSWFSGSGKSWSSPRFFGEQHWWIWRIIWQNNKALGLAYHGGPQQLTLFTGHPGKNMQRHPIPAMSLARDKLGYPNESDMHISSDGLITALVRRDADSFTAQLGTSKPPYNRWYWRDLKTYIGGPAMVMLTEGYVLVAGRQWTGKKLVTQIWLLDLAKASLVPCLTLPSGGDNSYPGLVIQDDTLFISYYSGHTDDETRVYFARVSGVNKLRDIIKQGKV